MDKRSELKQVLHGMVSRGQLCCKWMPRKGITAVELRNHLNLSPRTYRKRLVRSTDVVEQLMCAKRWEDIDFERVPSVAQSRYSKCFNKRATESYGAYRAALVAGAAKVNVGAIFPVDVIKSIMYGGDEEVMDCQWNALPNYIGEASVLSIVDLSGSMICGAGGSPSVTCADIATSLGLYIADKNEGAFHGVYLSFSANSELNILRGKTIADRYREMQNCSRGMNTNLAKAFDRILSVAVEHKVAQEHMPSVLLVLSDMQFDKPEGNVYGHYGNSDGNWNETAIELARRKYTEAGYAMPSVVFWNLNSHPSTPARVTDEGVAMVSGYSPSIMKAILQCKEVDTEEFSPRNVMLAAIGSERYNIPALED